MGTIAEKLTYLDETRERIRQGINSIGGALTTSDTFRSYSDAIEGIYEKFPKVEGTGSNITLENTMEASIKSELEGNTTQEGTPTPDSPQPINVVSGRQEVSVVGKNLFDNTIQPTFINSNNMTISTIDTGKKLVWNSSNSTNYIFSAFAIMDLTNYVGKTIRFKCNFTASGSNIPQYIIGLCNADGTNRTSKAITKTSDTTLSFTVPTLVGEQKYLLLSLYINELGTLALNDYVEFTNMVLTIDNEDMTYEPYKGQSYEINLGKNLYGGFTYSRNTNGISFQYNEDGTITADGTANGTALSMLSSGASSYLKTLSAGTYTISGASNNVKIEVLKSDGTLIVQTTSSDTFTLSEETQVFIRLNVSSGTQLNNIKVYQMLEKGSQATSYSPYKTPIELCKIGDYKDSIKKSTGKNLFDKDNANILQVNLNNETSISGVSSSNRTLYIAVQPNTTYTISKLKTNYFVIGTTEEVPARNLAYYQRQSDATANSLTITTNSTAKYLICWFWNSSDTLTEQEILDSIMINEGTTALPYEPYGKVWYIERQVGHYNGKLTYSSTPYNSTYLRTFGNFEGNWVKSSNSNGYVNYYSVVFGGSVNQIRENGKCMLRQSGNENANNLYFWNTNITSDETAKTYMDNTIFDIYYQVETPTTTEITDSELIEQLEELGDAKSYEGTTNINVDGDLPTILNVKALEDIFSQ